MAIWTADKSNGTGPGTIEVEVGANPLEQERVDFLYINSVRTGKKYPVKITQEKSDQVVVIPPFDFLVLRYSWTDNDGQDFDSATGFINTGISGVDNVLVGWSKRYEYTQEYVGAGSARYLIHGGDNQASGLESVLIQMSTLLESSSLDPNIKDIQLKVYGNWYKTLGNGRVTISFTAYKGGYMNKQGFNFYNYEGEEVYTGEATTTVRAQGEDNNANIVGTYTEMATIYYDRDTRDCFIQLKS